MTDALHAFAQQASHHQQQKNLRHQQPFGFAAATGAIACRGFALGAVALADLRGRGMDRCPALSQLPGGEEKDQPQHERARKLANKALGCGGEVLHRLS